MNAIAEQTQDREIELNYKINFSAEAARRLIGRHVANTIGMLLMADEPTLFLTRRLVWRVPITYANPVDGYMGIVGTVDVDVELGTFSLSDDKIESIKQCVNDKLAHTALQATIRS